MTPAAMREPSQAHQHILFAVNNYPPLSGGVEQHVFELARQLVIDGVRCTVVTLSNQQSDTMEHGVRVIRRPRRGNIGGVLSFPHFGTKTWLSKFIRDNKVTAVSVHTRFFPLTWVGVAAARSTHVPSILTEHGSAHVRGVSRLVGAASWLVDVTLGRRAMRTATVRLAVSNESAQFVHKLSGKTAQVFPNATNVDFWYRNTPIRPSRFAFVGRIVPQKGWAESIEAFTAFAELNFATSYELHVVGDGIELASARQQASNSPASNRIHVHGRQSHEQIRELLAGQWLLNPTQLSEGFQTTILEAAMSGAGIISYPAPGLTELEESGATVLRVSSVAQLTERMSLASTTTPTALSPEDAKRWGWPARAETYLQIVQRAQR